MNARRRSLDKWKEDSEQATSKENSAITIHHPSSSAADHSSTFNNHITAQFSIPNDSNGAYGASTNDAIIPPLCGSSGGHLNFSTSHHLHTYGLQQSSQQYIGQSQMIGCNSLSSSSFIHGYQPQAHSLPQTSQLISPR